MKTPAARGLWRWWVAKEASRPHRRGRTKSFDDRYRWIGPAIFALTISYFIAQVFVAAAFTPSYSWLTNTISDLGNTSCKVQLCSPRHVWMNAAFIALGGFMLLGSPLIFEEFSERGPDQRAAARLGFGLTAIGGLGAVIVGLFPENTVGLVHVIGAGFGIGLGTLGILVLGLALSLSSRPLRLAMRVVPPIALVALVLFATRHYLGLGAGTMERIAAYPEAIWLVVFGVYISHSRFVRAARRPLLTPPPA
jgi:hypothetical membrane protein